MQILWLFGHHAVQAALKANKRTFKQLWVTPNNEETYKALAVQAGVRMQTVDRKKLDGLSQQPHQGVGLEASNLPATHLKDLYHTDLLLALDQVTDPHNVGACLRSANAFGCGGVLVPSAHSPKDSPIIAKAGAGALEDTPLVTVGNLAQALENLKKEGFWIVGLDGHTEQTLSDIDLKGKIVLVMGSEGDGLRDLVRKKCDFIAKLPMGGTVESLNVSVAAGIALYEVRRK